MALSNKTRWHTLCCAASGQRTATKIQTLQRGRAVRKEHAAAAKKRAEEAAAALAVVKKAEAAATKRKAEEAARLERARGVPAPLPPGLRTTSQYGETAYLV